MGNRASLKQPHHSTTPRKRPYGIDIGTGVPSNPPIVGKPIKTTKSVRLRLDVPLLVTLGVLIFIGLIILYTASYDYSRRFSGDPYRMITRQIIWLGLGLVAFTVLIFFDYHHLKRFAVWALLFTFFALIIVLLLPENSFNNANRSAWGASVRPSELAKIVIVIYVSVWLYTRKERLTNMGLGLIPLSFVLAITGTLIALQPDFSAVLTIFFLGSVVFFLAGGEIKQLLLLLGAALVMALIMVPFSATITDRLQSFWNGWKDFRLVSEQIRGAYEAFVNGGWFGTGLGKGVVKLLDLYVPPTDSIYAVVGEEFGVWGSFSLIIVYLVLLWRGLWIAKRAPDQLGSLLAGGLSIWLAFEAFVNMAVILNVLPFAGNALPFVSAGGSHLGVSLMAMGIILNISRQMVDKESENNFGTFINLRRRNWRRSVSSSDNMASSGSQTKG
jgi:cell division protein FtsW